MTYISGGYNSYSYPAYGFKGVNSQVNKDADIYSKLPKYLAKQDASSVKEDSSYSTWKTLATLVGLALVGIGLYKGRKLMNGNLKTTLQEPAIATTQRTTSANSVPVQTTVRSTETASVSAQTVSATVKTSPVASQAATTAEQNVLNTSSFADDSIKVAQKSVKEPKITIKGNTKTIEETIELTSKDGKKHQAVLIKNETLEDGPWGKRIDYKYTIKDADGKRIAECDGLIERGVLKGHGIQSFAFNMGLGKKLKEVIKQQAIEHGCGSINIEAAYASHVFHNKMGYKVNFVDDMTTTYNVNKAKDLLKSINTKAQLPEFTERINNIIADTNAKAKDVNALFDEILSFANGKGLKSDEIGLAGHCVPMTYKL